MDVDSDAEWVDPHTHQPQHILLVVFSPFLYLLITHSALPAARLLSKNPAIIYSINLFHSVMASFTVALVVLQGLLSPWKKFSCPVLMSMTVTSLGVLSLSALVIFLTRAHASMSRPRFLRWFGGGIIVDALVVFGLGYIDHDPPEVIPSELLPTCHMHFHPAWVGVKGGTDVLPAILLTVLFLRGLSPQVTSLGGTTLRSLHREDLAYGFAVSAISVGTAGVVLSGVLRGWDIYVYVVHMSLVSILLTAHLDRPPIPLSQEASSKEATSPPITTHHSSSARCVAPSTLYVGVVHTRAPFAHSTLGGYADTRYPPPDEYARVDHMPAVSPPVGDMVRDRPA